MTGMYDQVRPGIGHNQPDEYAEEKKHEKWERWAKKRTFVRALEGTRRSGSIRPATCRGRAAPANSARA